MHLLLFQAVAFAGLILAVGYQKRIEEVVTSAVFVSQVALFLVGDY